MTSLAKVDALIKKIDADTESKIDDIKVDDGVTKSLKDPSSFANIDEILINYADINLNVNFNSRILSGYVIFTFKNVCNKAITQVILDTRDLKIKEIFNESNNKSLKFVIGKGNNKVPTLGKPLIITLDKATKNDIKLKILYETSNKAEAIQWLNANQTAGKKLPYMFTQCQAIACRTMLPCQDSCSAKMQYIANITVANIGYTVVMSAIPSGKSVSSDKKTVTFKFEQKIPIPSYLIAMVIGDLVRKDISDRCGVWADPAVVDEGVFEFSNTDKMLTIAENICGKYVWNRYDILLCPPAFPYGGMENPNLTFVTPTLIAGDKSLDNVIAHEIVHSWTGNLVTNRTWEHFWLNEGWTRFIESKIMGRIRGKEYQKLDIINSKTAMDGSVAQMNNGEFTKLNLSLKDADPDDAFSSIPYEKGSAFLRYLEELVGGETIFESFIKKYVDNFKYKTLDTYDFKEFFLNYFTKVIPVDETILNKIDWKLWFKGTGGAPIFKVPECKLIKDAKLLVDKWCTDDYNGNINDIKGYFVQQIELLLDSLYEIWSKQLKDKKCTVNDLLKRLNKMKECYGFNKSKNNEILFRFNKLALLCNDNTQYNSVVTMLGAVGRMKFVRPLYRELIKNKDRYKLAQQTYDTNKNFYHPICAKMVKNDLDKVF